MTDRELLELAAKAAGIDLSGATFDGYGDVIQSYWNPLTNDGDALRLAVQLDILWREDRHYTKYLDLSETDKFAATRRAITRAAAEIGKGMK